VISILVGWSGTIQNYLQIDQHQFSQALQHSIPNDAYRVILTRNRDGLIIYILEKPELEETWHTLKHVLRIEKLI